MSVQTPTDDGDDSAGPDQRPPRLVVEERPIAELLPFLPRRRSYDLNAIVGAATSISADGFPHPVILGHHGQIVDGALLIDAARWLDRETVPCLSMAKLGGAEERCLRQLLMSKALPPDWTLQTLMTAIETLILAEEQAALEGFEPIDLDQILAEQSVPGEEDAD